MIEPHPSCPAACHRPFPVFALIWAITTLMHQLAFTFWAETWQGWILVAAVVQVIFQPACVLRFGILVATSLLHLWDKLPFVPNHILYEGMLHLIIGIALAECFVSGIRRRRFAAARWGSVSGWLLVLGAAGLKILYHTVPGVPQHLVLDYVTTLIVPCAFTHWLRSLPVVEQGAEGCFSRFAPVMRATVVVMYVWAGIQKLNWDYLNPDISCAATFHREIAAYFGAVIPTAPWALHAAIWGSYAFEFGIPLLLLFARTRFLGFGAAILFHLWLSIHPAAGIFSYSSLMLAQLVLFMPASWGGRLQALWRGQLVWLGKGHEDRGRRLARWGVVVLFMAALVGQITLYLLRGRDHAIFQTANRIGFFVFFAWGCWLSACYLVAGWSARHDPACLPNRSRWTLAWVGLVPVLVNGFIPWIGGRTQTSFSMFSNLRTEGSGNHLFLRRMDFFQLQTDLVQVLASVPDILVPPAHPHSIQQFANPGNSVMPWFELRRLVSEMPGDFEVTYRRHDQEFKLGRSKGIPFGDPGAFEPLPFLQRKFLWCRRLKALDEPMCCTH